MSRCERRGGLRRRSAPTTRGVWVAQWNARYARTLATLGRSDLEEATRQAAGLFETALTILGIDRRPFDLARVQLAYGARLRRIRTPTVSQAHLTAALGRSSASTANHFHLPNPEVHRND